VTRIRQHESYLLRRSRQERKKKEKGKDGPVTLKVSSRSEKKGEKERHLPKPKGGRSAVRTELNVVLHGQRVEKREKRKKKRRIWFLLSGEGGERKGRRGGGPGRDGGRRFITPDRDGN